MDRIYIEDVAESIRRTLSLEVPICANDLQQSIINNLRSMQMKEDARLLIRNKKDFTIEYREGMASEDVLFAIAYEIGHICLHLLNDDATISERTKFSKEQEADAREFAVSFLMPVDVFITKCKEYHNNRTVNVSKVAEYFHVSPRLVSIRGSEIGIW